MAEQFASGQKGNFALDMPVALAIATYEANHEALFREYRDDGFGHGDGSGHGLHGPRIV